MAPPWLSPISRLHPFPILKRGWPSTAPASERAPSIPPTHTNAFLPSTFALPSPGNLYTQLLLQDPAKGSLLCVAPTPWALVDSVTPAPARGAEHRPLSNTYQPILFTSYPLPPPAALEAPGGQGLCFSFQMCG